MILKCAEKRLFIGNAVGDKFVMLAIQLKMKIKQRKKAGMSMDVIFYHPTLIRLTGLRHFRQRYRGARA